MRRSAAALLGVFGGMVAGAVFIRRQSARGPRVDLYYADGSMVSLTDGAPGSEQLLPLARKILRNAR